MHVLLVGKTNERTVDMYLLFVPSIAALVLIGYLQLRDYFGSRGNVN